MSVYVIKVQFTFFKNTTYTSFKIGDHSILSNLIKHTFYSHCHRGHISNDVRVELSGKVQGKYISSEKAQDHAVSIPCSQTENAWTIIRRKRKRSDSARDKSHCTNRKKNKKQRDNTKTPQKLLLHNDCGPT